MYKRFLPTLFGALAALPIAIPKIGLMQWVVLIPFAFLCLSEGDDKSGKRLRREYFYGFGFFFGFYLVCFSWFLSMYPLSVTGLPRIAALGVVIFAWVGLPLFQTAGFSLIFPVFRAAMRRGLPKGILPIFMGALWCICEWIQNFFWFGIPWVKLALGQTEHTSLFRSVNLFGSYFVTFLIVSVNFYIALALREGVKRKRQIFAFTAVVIFFSNAFYGMLDIRVSQITDRDTVCISAFQGNVSTTEKWSSDMLTGSYEIYDRLAKEASEQGADYAILPETVFPYNVVNFPEIEARIADIASSYNITLMVGAFGEVNGGTGNVIRVYEPEREGVTVYAKQRPVPFGEYVPMRSFIMTVLPVLGEINMLDRSLEPGSESSVWKSDNATFGYLICFDSIYDSYARESVKNGADILLISTNDSWFGDSIGTRMHSAQAKLRAVETGRSVVRAANTGISSIITPDGETLSFIECDREGQITANVPVSDGLTLYTRIENLFVYVCIAFIIFCLFLEKIRNKITVRSS